MINAVKTILRNLLPDQTLGLIDYYRFPHWRSKTVRPFNNQSGRLEIFNELVEKCQPHYIIETGTYHGTTTEFFSLSTGLPVFSIEANSRTYGFARTRLKHKKNVELHLGDSRKELHSIRDHNDLDRKRGLIYLDAHWGEELPLGDELRFVFTSLPNSVVVIDDFQVPDDNGYGYDDYGPGKTLDLTYLAPALDCFNANPYFPALSSSEETGARRGCCVLSVDPEVEKLLSACTSIRRGSGP